MPPRSRRIRIAAALAQLLPCTGAVAADEPMRRIDWSGFHFGAQVGRSSASTRWQGAESQFFGIQGVRAPDADGVVGGLRAGYDASLGKGIVAGVIGEGNLASASSRVGPAGRFGVDRFAILSGRVGYAFESVLFYGSAGGALGGVRIVSPVSGGTAQAAAGWSAGAGVEYAITRHLALGVNYRYLNFERIGFGGGAAGEARAGTDVQSLQGSVSYRW